jgi:hypothetical protein
MIYASLLAQSNLDTTQELKYQDSKCRNVIILNVNEQDDETID